MAQGIDGKHMTQDGHILSRISDRDQSTSTRLQHSVNLKEKMMLREEHQLSENEEDFMQACRNSSKSKTIPFIFLIRKLILFEYI